jgi:hypothetical protein
VVGNRCYTGHLGAFEVFKGFRTFSGLGGSHMNCGRRCWNALLGGSHSLTRKCVKKPDAGSWMPSLGKT